MRWRALLSRAQCSQRIKSLFICTSFDFPRAQGCSVIHNASLLGSLWYGLFHSFCVLSKSTSTEKQGQLFTLTSSDKVDNFSARSFYSCVSISVQAWVWLCKYPQVKTKKTQWCVSLPYMHFMPAHVRSMWMTLYLRVGLCTLTADNGDRESGCRIAQNS